MNTKINYKLSIEEPVTPKEQRTPKKGHLYKRKIKQFIDHLHARDLKILSIILGVILLDVKSGLKIGLSTPLGWKKHFHFSHLNPKKISESELQQQPILLIHGRLHNQSVWLSLARQLKKNNVGPVFTINLKNKSEHDDYNLIDAKMDEIAELYKKSGRENVKINLIGYSRGGHLANQINAYRSIEKKDVGKVINIGYTVDEKQVIHDKHGQLNRTYEITAIFDVLHRAPSHLSSNRQAKIKKAHLGLVFSSKTHKTIIKWLSLE